MELGALLVVGLSAVTDWWAVWTQRDRLEMVAKPLVMLSLLVYVLVASSDATLQWWLAAALTFGLIGDVLLLPDLDYFRLGLAAFLVGHLGYLGAAFTVGTGHEPWLILGALLATSGILVVGRPIARAVAGTELHLPVVLYICAVGLVVTFMAGTAVAAAFVGAVMFAASDGLLGWTRFVHERGDTRIVVHASYHVGQALMVIGLIATGP